MKEEAPRDVSKGAAIDILRGELLFVPWYVNERTATGSAFATAKAAINDPVASLIKISEFHKICKSSWKIRDSLSVLTRSAEKCVILTPLVKCAQNDPKMIHITIT